VEVAEERIDSPCLSTESFNEPFMMRKEFRSLFSLWLSRSVVKLSNRLVNTDESILSVAKILYLGMVRTTGLLIQIKAYYQLQKYLLPKNGKDMMLLPVRLVVIFNKCL